MRKDVLRAQALSCGQSIPERGAFHIHRVQPSGLIWPPILLELAQRLHINLQQLPCCSTDIEGISIIAKMAVKRRIYINITTEGVAPFTGTQTRQFHGYKVINVSYAAKMHALIAFTPVVGDPNLRAS